MTICVLAVVVVVARKLAKAGVTKASMATMMEQEIFMVYSWLLLKSRNVGVQVFLEALRLLEARIVSLEWSRFLSKPWLYPGFSSLLVPFTVALYRFYTW
jgi:uncharacterized protein YbaA (DUF1428 family)